MLTLFPAGELDWAIWKGREDIHILLSVPLATFTTNVPSS